MPDWGGWRAGTRLAALALAILARSAMADLVVPPGATIDLGTGTFDLGCTDVQVAGTLIVGGTLNNVRHFSILPGGNVLTTNGSIDVGGNWSNQGSFGSGTTIVRFRDLCGVADATISGNTTFSDVSFVTTTGKAYRFAVGSNQTITGLLEMLGTGAPIRFYSTLAGNVATIDLKPSGTQQILNVGVSDVWAIGQWLAPNQTNVPGFGNANRWFGVPTANTPIPLIDRTALAVLAALLALAGSLAIRRRREAPRGRMP